MSPTSSPSRPARSPTLVHEEEESELQAFLAAAKREAQEKWERLRAVKASGVVEKVVGGGGEIVEVKEAIEQSMEDAIEVKQEVVLKVEPKPSTTNNSNFPNQAEEPNPFVANAQSFTPYSESILLVGILSGDVEEDEELFLMENGIVVVAEVDMVK
ncbi:hypothetical protein F5050DRAFT_1812733 [Lentinula boryana]|uniref:Uncharacterized protein n=1 Tax=Lentinula boryana TaxID=40481 RepID=A0ABQ8PY34_9AGAR|nr:hypothetical protein F5050DRAFT_1812733 [Lentinula boryana]